GGEVLRALKDDAYTRSIPVIMFSSSRSQADIHRAYDLHANCYIAKPFDLDGMLEVVKSIQNFWTLTAQLPK
ncbi:MAG TPA: response regulator, partial [Bryobacteraceae bacterium]|nr:response regulator [Bryobacteraceae bacterium]